MTEEQVKASVRLMSGLERELYFDNLEIAKVRLGLPLIERSLEAANQALARTIQNRRVRREKSWPYCGERL